MKTITNITCHAFALFALACFGLSPTVRAVSPPPDGGYSGANTAEGDNALLNLSSGIANTAVGFNALNANTTGGWDGADCFLAPANHTDRSVTNANPAHAL